MFIMLLMQAKEDEFMNKEINVVCYIRAAVFEQIESREQKLRAYAKKNNYKISDFIIEQRSGLADCSITLNGLLHNQSVENILIPNISSLSRNIFVLNNIINIAKKNNKDIISTDGSCEAYLLDW